MRHLLVVLVLVSTAAPAEARWRPRIPDAVKRIGARIGDRLVRFRGFERSMGRVERLYESGQDRRSLSILRGVLKGKSLDATQKARALLYTGAIQTRLGNHDQATRAFAGVAHHRPDFDLPASIGPDVRQNFDWGRHLAVTGGTRSESIAAQLPPAKKRPSLWNRLNRMKAEATDRYWTALEKNPRLKALVAGTVGRFNVWRAQNTLERHGVPRFKVNLERDGKQAGGAYTRQDGTVAIDHSLTLRYSTALDTLAHEAWHVLRPNELTPQTGNFLRVYSESAASIDQLRKEGRGIPKGSADGLARRKKIAQDLRFHRKMLRNSVKALRGQRLKEEGAAEHFAGEVLAWENLPLTHAIHGRTRYEADPWHPKPADMARYFMDGVSTSLEQMTGLKINRQMTRQREAANRMLERLQEQRQVRPGSPPSPAP
jgi:hypothetical protein